MTYITVDEPSACGIHPGTEHRWCRACLRAKAATMAALAHVERKEAKPSRGASHGQRVAHNAVMPVKGDRERRATLPFHVGRAAR